jgi:hypothetical protein
MECEFCKKNLSSLSNLNYHKKTNKSCLKIQLQEKNNKEQIETLLISCEFCHKLFTSHKLKIHLKTCKHKNISLIEKKDDEIKSLIEKKDDEIKNLNDEIKSLNDEIKSLIDRVKMSSDRIIELETANKIFSKDHDEIIKIANKPNNITTTNNNILNNTNTSTSFNFNDPEKVKLMIDSKLTKNHIVDGQKGVAQFACDTILKDDEGNMNYFCTDTSRGMFRFQNAKGEFEKDVKAKKLTSMLIDAGIKNKSMDIATNLWMNDDGSINPERFRIFNPNAQEIIMMENDNSVFRNELACLTSV